MTGLSACFRVERAAFTLSLDLTVPPGTVTVIVGPNGSGKTTTLRTLAGLTRPTAGHISLGERTLDDAATHVEPRDRRTGVVFQDYLLFPHLSALDNVAFGLIAHGTPRARAHAAAREWLARFGMPELASVRPAELSGGQSQRVALARALILEPPLLLLDEPLAALDSSTRVLVRSDVKQELRAYDGSTVMVTHDPADAMALADEVVVLDGGTAVQRGTPSEVAGAPINEYVAGLFGH